MIPELIILIINLIVWLALGICIGIEIRRLVAKVRMRRDGYVDTILPIRLAHAVHAALEEMKERELPHFTIRIVNTSCTAEDIENAEEIIRKINEQEEP